MQNPYMFLLPVDETTIADWLIFRSHTMSSALTSLVCVLDGTNYQQWAAQMQSYLMSQGQRKCVIKTAPGLIEKEEEADEATGKEAKVVTNQDVLDAWEETNSKAVGNIRLCLHHTIGYQYNTEESTQALWQALAKKYGSPGIQRMYIEFKGTMEVRIPDNGDPFPTIDKLLTHFTRL